MCCFEFLPRRPRPFAPQTVWMFLPESTRRSKTHREQHPLNTDTHLSAAALCPLIPRERTATYARFSVRLQKTYFIGRGVSLEYSLINSTWPFSLCEMHCCVCGTAVADSGRRWVECELPCQSNWRTPTQKTKITTNTKPPK